MKHFTLNPVELAWVGLKNYVRDHNVNFTLGDVRHLSYQWMMSLGTETAIGYINRTRKIESIYKKSDRFTEQIEEELVNEEEEVDSEGEEIAN